MQFNKILASILISSIVLTGCNTEEKNDSQKNKETKNTNQSSTHLNASNIIEKANEKAKTIKSYRVDKQISIQSGNDKESQSERMVVDKNNTIKLTNKVGSKKQDIYIFDDKYIVSPDGQNYFDASESLDDNSKKQLKNQKFETQFNFSGYDDATAKSTKNGYEISKHYKNFDEYKKLINKTGSNPISEKDEKDIQSYSGVISFTFDKDYKLLNSKVKDNIKSKDKEFVKIQSVDYSKHNKVSDIEIPKEAKNPQKLEISK